MTTAHDCQWHQLDDDARVSHAEQQDRMPSVGAPSAWMVIGLGLSPIFVIGVVSLVALLLS